MRRPTLVRRYVLLMVGGFLALGLSTSALAQVGAVIQMVQAEVCTFNNWDTPEFQSQVPQQRRFALFGGSKLEPVVKQCLIEKHPYPQALCSQFLNGEIDSLPPDARSNSCDHVEHDKKAAALAKGWRPQDLQPDAKTLAILLRAAQGDVPSQVQAVRMYERGDGVPINPEFAQIWRVRAADQGDLAMQLELGERYITVGLANLVPDDTLAQHYFTLAAKQGSARAMLNLGYLARGKHPIEATPKLAMDWFSKAAGAGSGYAALVLGDIYQARRDMPHAMQWYTKAAALNEAMAMLKLAAIGQVSASLAQRKSAQVWRRKADALGEQGSTRYLMGYYPWDEPAKDEDAAVAIQLKYANAGDIDAQLAIAAKLYLDDRHIEEAAVWWQKAALAGDPIGKRMLGKYLLNTLGGDSAPEQTPEVIRTGLDWLEQAAAQGDQEAQASLGYAYLNLPTDDPQAATANRLKAKQWMYKAADSGYRPEDTRARAAMW